MFKLLKILLKKELTDIFRDKKTVFMMLIFPLFLYPILIVAAGMILPMVINGEMKKETIIAFDTTVDDAYVEHFEEIYEEQKEEMGSILSFVKVEEDGAAKLEAEEVHLVVSQSMNEETKNPQFDLMFYQANTTSSRANNLFIDLFEDYKEELIATSIEELGLEQSFLEPISVVEHNQSSVSESMGIAMGGSIGLMIIMLLTVSAFYPTVDVTAGERERGTLETQFTLPVSNTQIIMSKFLAVTIVSFTAGIISLIAIAGSLAFLFFQLGGLMEGSGISFELTNPPLMICYSVLLVFATSLLVVALTMIVSIFARSFKEANNYLTPVMLVLMFGSYPAMLESMVLNRMTALIPVLNISLAFKAMISGTATGDVIFITIITNLCISFLIIKLLAKFYSSESILFGEGLSSWNLIQSRKDMKKGRIPAIGEAVIVCVTVLLLMIYVGPILMIYFGNLGVMGQQLMILLVPIAFMWYGKYHMKETYVLKKASVRSFAASIFILIGYYPLMNLIGILAMELFPNSLDSLELAFLDLASLPFPLLLFVIAVLPAIGEELLFRGILMSSIKKKHGVALSIVVTSIVFGLYHMSIVKFFTTGLIGLMLALIVTYSGSIYPAMLVHFLNNAVGAVALKFQDSMGDEMAEMLGEVEQVQLGVGDVLASCIFSAVFLGIGFSLLLYKRK